MRRLEALAVKKKTKNVTMDVVVGEKKMLQNQIRQAV